jgi:molybdopterin biosynthesis enzyme MoaB
LRTDSFYDEMVEYIDVGIVVAAERFSLILFEEAAEHMDNCIVRIVTTRGGGGVNDMDMSMLAVARGFSKAIDTVMDTMATSDIFTMVGHSTPIRPSSLSVKGKKWEKHESVPPMRAGG